MNTHDELIVSAFNEEGLRRMARRADIEAISQSGDLQVIPTIRNYGNIILTNIANKCIIYADHHGRKTIDEHILQESLDYLNIKADFYHIPPENQAFPQCESYRQRMARKKEEANASGKPLPRKKRGALAKQEMEHEKKQDDCVYLEFASVARLFKFILSEEKEGMKVTLATMTGIQYIVERILIKILHFAGEIARTGSSGNKENSKPKRLGINARDVRTAVRILSECWKPFLDGFIKKRYVEEPKAKAKAKAKASGKPKAKASGKPKAKATAKAKD